MSSPTKTILKATTAALAACSLGILTSCSLADEEEVHRGKPTGAPAEIINMPAGHTDIATKCDGPNRIYVGTHDNGAASSIAVVPNDPRCTSTPNRP